MSLVYTPSAEFLANYPKTGMLPATPSITAAADQATTRQNISPLLIAAIALLAVLSLALIAVLIWLAVTGPGTITSSGIDAASVPVSSSTPVPSTPEVFSFNPSAAGSTYSTVADADAGCQTVGARLANVSQLIIASDAGAQWCIPGFITDGQILYPMNTPVPGCGNNPGINASETGPPAAANCYGIKPRQGTPGVAAFNQYKWNQTDPDPVAASGAIAASLSSTSASSASSSSLSSRFTSRDASASDNHFAPLTSYNHPQPSKNSTITRWN